MKKIISGDPASQCTLLFLHGTHTTYDSNWMEQISTALSELPVKIIRPEFPSIYKENSEHNDQTIKLVEYIVDFVQNEKIGNNLIVVGKSLGAKVAVEFATNHPVKSLLLLGFPMTYQSGKVRAERVEKINSLDLPVQIIQGEFDRYGKKEILSKLNFKKNIELKWIDKVDHSYLAQGDDDINSINIQNIIQLIKQNFNLY